jgi:choline kinase
MVIQTFLFEGYNDHFMQLIGDQSEDAVFPVVFCHNDTLENNILINLNDNKKLIMIDYEYGGWNPMAMDLANYLNETMLDNSYPEKSGIAWYLENCMTHEELKKMATSYMSTYFNKFMKPAHK